MDKQKGIFKSQDDCYQHRFTISEVNYIFTLYLPIYKLTGKCVCKPERYKHIVFLTKTITVTFEEGGNLNLPFVCLVVIDHKRKIVSVVGVVYKRY